VSFEEGRSCTPGSLEAEKLMEKGRGNLGYLKMVGGKGKKASIGANRGKDENGEDEELASSTPSPRKSKTTFVFDKTTKKVVEGRGAMSPSGAKYSNWHGGNLDPDSVKTHQRQLKRAGFTDNRSVIGDLF